MKEFNTLLKSEIKKAERFANKITGYNDCKVTAYSSNRDMNFCGGDFVECKLEICRNYEDVVETENPIILVVPMFDRRKSYVCTVINGEFVKSNK